MRGKDKEKFTIIIRVRPRIKDDPLSYRETDMENILEVMMEVARVTHLR